jgi:hypothetical protein
MGVLRDSTQAVQVNCILLSKEQWYTNRGLAKAPEGG